MITKFKLYENDEIKDPKYKVGDAVYIRTSEIKRKCMITDVISQYDRPDNNGNRYILDRYPEITVREEVLDADYEVDSKKYNL